MFGNYDSYLWGKNTEFYPLICFMDCLFVGQNIIELSSIDSTNTYLTNLSQSKNLAEGTVVLANQQNSGKGQRNKSWQSEAGKSLCASILLKPIVDLRQQFKFNKFIALSVCQAFNYYQIKASIKWPNDIFIENKKIAGILIENTIRGDKIDKSIIGIGINVNNDTQGIPNATSLSQHLKQHPSIKSLLEVVCQNIEKNYFLFKKDSPLINKLYNDNLFRRGEHQLFYKDGELFDGTIESVNEDGQLVIRVKEEQEFYNMGEIEFKI